MIHIKLIKLSEKQTKKIMRELHFFSRSFENHAFCER